MAGDVCTGGGKGGSAGVVPSRRVQYGGGASVYLPWQVAMCVGWCCVYEGGEGWEEEEEED